MTGFPFVTFGRWEARLELATNEFSSSMATAHSPALGWLVPKYGSANNIAAKNDCIETAVIDK